MPEPESASEGSSGGEEEEQRDAQGESKEGGQRKTRWRERQAATHHQWVEMFGRAPRRDLGLGGDCLRVL